MLKNDMRPVHPGEVLLEEFLKPAVFPLNANRLAKALEVPANRITVDSQRAAWHYGRYGDSPGDVPQYHR
jgi:hypothetical protein